MKEAVNISLTVLDVTNPDYPMIRFVTVNSCAPRQEKLNKVRSTLREINLLDSNIDPEFTLIRQHRRLPAEN